MPRGGARPGSGPTPDPNSARSKARAAKAAKLGLVLATPPVATPPSRQPAQPAALDQTGAKAETKTDREQPLDLMFRLMTCGDPRIELQAAIAAAPYVHPKFMPVKAKSDEKDKKPNRFAVHNPPPRLVFNKP